MQEILWTHDYYELYELYVERVEVRAPPPRTLETNNKLHSQATTCIHVWPDLGDFLVRAKRAEENFAL